MRFARGMRLLAAVLALSTPSLAMGTKPYPEASSYDSSANNAAAQLDAALARARASGKKVLLIMGANWCHDSRALAGWLETPRLKALLADKFETLFVDVGTPQSGQGRNLELAQRFGVEMKGTPNVLILSTSGELLNRKTATRWRNASSRSEAEIYDELAKAAS